MNKKLLPLLLLLTFAFACAEKETKTIVEQPVNIYNTTHEVIYSAESVEESEIIVNTGRTVFSKFDSIYLDFEIIDTKGLIDPDSVDIIFMNTEIVSHGHLLRSSENAESDILICDSSRIKISSYPVGNMGVSHVNQEVYPIDIYITNTSGKFYPLGWDIIID